MLNNIKKIQLETPIAQQSINSAFEQPKNSIFETKSNYLTDKPDEKKPTKDEIKAQKKAAKEAEKAEKERIANNPDGIIQGGKQGSSAGDCWLLSEMNSLATTDWGKDLLSKAITKDDKGNFTVDFKGVEKKYLISAEEFNNGKKNSYYSKQDADALILELAVEKHFKTEKLNNETIYGNDLAGKDSLQYLISGTTGRQTTNKELMDTIATVMGKEESKGSIAATYIYYDNSQGPNGVHHAMSIKDIILDDKGKPKKIIVVDPYNPDKPITKDYYTFRNEATVFAYTLKPLTKEKIAEEKQFEQVM